MRPIKVEIVITHERAIQYIFDMLKPVVESGDIEELKITRKMEGDKK